MPPSARDALVSHAIDTVGCAFGALFLALWNLALGHFRGEGYRRRDLAFAALAGGLLALCWVCLFAGFAMTSIATATIVFQSYPFMLILAGWLIWRERITLEQFLWIVIAFVGVALASGALAVPAFTGGLWLPGIGLTLLSAASYVGVTVLVRAIRGQLEGRRAHEPELPGLAGAVGVDGVDRVLLQPRARLGAVEDIVGRDMNHPACDTGTSLCDVARGVAIGSKSSVLLVLGFIDCRVGGGVDNRVGLKSQHALLDLRAISNINLSSDW